MGASNQIVFFFPDLLPSAIPRSPVMRKVSVTLLLGRSTDTRRSVMS